MIPWDGICIVEVNWICRSIQVFDRLFAILDGLAGVHLFFVDSFAVDVVVGV